MQSVPRGFWRPSFLSSSLYIFNYQDNILCSQHAWGAGRLDSGINFIQLLNPKCGCLYIVKLFITLKNRRRAKKKKNHKGLNIFQPKSVLCLLFLWSWKSTGSHKNFTGAIIIWNFQGVSKALYNNLKYHNLILFLLFYL